MNREPGGLQSMGSQESDTTKRLNYNHIRKPSQESRQRSCRPQSFPGAVIAPPPALAGPSVSRTTNLLSLEVSCIFSVLHKCSHTKLLFCGGGSCYSQKNYFKIYPCSHMHQKYILSQQWDGWMASLTQWTWVWASSGRWWRTRSLVCCSPLGCKELVMTEWLNNNKLCSTNGFSQFSVPMVSMPLHLKIASVNESFLRMEAPNRS